MLLATLRHQILKLAKEFDLIEQVADQYRTAIWQTARKYANLFGQKLAVELPDSPNSSIRHGLWTLDTDKVMYVVLVTDELGNYETDRVFGEWETKDAVKALQDTHLAVEEFVFNNFPGLNEIFVLYLYAGVGRGAIFGFDEPLPPFRSARSVLSVSDFVVIAKLEANDPLVLLKFAKMQDEIRNTAKILAFSPLDEFTAYRKNQYSYYFSDDGRPDLISLTPDTGTELRLEVLKEFDRHSVISYRAGYFTEVLAVNGTSRIPVYLETEGLDKTLAVLVEGFDIPIWIIDSGQQAEIETFGLTYIYSEFLQMIAYWLWQFSPALKKYFQALSGVENLLVLRLNLEATSDWVSMPSSNNSTVEDNVQYSILTSEPEISFLWKANVAHIFSTPDNRGERFVMKYVLIAISDFLLGRGFNSLAARLADEVSRIIDEYAPLGLKKKIVWLNLNNNPQMDERNIPPFRAVQGADRGKLLDEVGNYLHDVMEVKKGAINSGQRNIILNQVVTYLYRRLQRLIATLRWDHLLEFLVAHNEAIIQEKASRELTIPTQLACFVDAPTLIEQLSKRLPEINRAAISSRFLIEYAVACPPHGFRPISISVYDELLAIASEIIDWANDSDLIMYEIADIQLSILGSGRLGSFHPSIHEARKKFVSSKTQEGIGSASKKLGR